MSNSITITEALAELKTITKRITKKREFIRGFCFRQNHLKDPHAESGGSAALLERESQAITDLQTRFVAIRCGIQKKNLTETLTVEGVTKTIAEWLAWRRDLSEEETRALTAIGQALEQMRRQAGQSGLAVLQAGAAANAKPTTDIVVNLDEKKLHERREKIETILGGLDGQLSLKNATLTIEV